MATEYEEWFASWRRESWANEAETSVLESYLDGSLTRSEAAENITAPAPDRRLPVDAKIGRVWGILFACATNCPEAHPTIIDLIREITSLPKPTDKKSVDWTDQQTPFGWLWRDTYDSLQSDLDSKYVAQHGSPSVSASQKWINFNAFSAAFEAAQIFSSTVTGYGMYGIIEALEKKSVKDPQLEARIPVAAYWFIHASRAILLHGKGMTSLWGEIGTQSWRDSILWKGKGGFSKERWDFWKERMEMFSKREQLSDDTREIARRAVVAMGKAERAKK